MAWSSGRRRTHCAEAHRGGTDMGPLLSASVRVCFACGGCNGRFASRSRCSRLPASIMTTRDDVCDTSGEEGSCSDQGCRSLITARWHANTHTYTLAHKFSLRLGYVSGFVGQSHTLLSSWASIFTETQQNFWGHLRSLQWASVSPPSCHSKQLGNFTDRKHWTSD